MARQITAVIAAVLVACTRQNRRRVLGNLARDSKLAPRTNVSDHMPAAALILAWPLCLDIVDTPREKRGSASRQSLSAIARNEISAKEASGFGSSEFSAGRILHLTLS